MAAARTPLTLMAVHAHPDDEAIGTGGVLARAAAEGIRTVVVTCTNGELGDAPGGVKPGEEGHDEAEVVAIRRAELEKACRELGVEHLEMLGYHDSGMVDWSYKGRSDVFAQVPVAEAAARLSGLFERYRPDVVISYEEGAAYDHPDHVQTARVALAAMKTATGPGGPEEVLPDRDEHAALGARDGGAEGSGYRVAVPGAEPRVVWNGWRRRRNASPPRSMSARSSTASGRRSRPTPARWTRHSSRACRPRPSGSRSGWSTSFRSHDATGAPLPEGTSSQGCAEPRVGFAQHLFLGADNESPARRRRSGEVRDPPASA